MKTKLLIFAAICVIPYKSFCFAFEKRNVTLSVGAGLGFYGTQVKQEYNTVMLNGTKSNKKYTASDFAVSAMYPITVEYGLKHWLGVGFRFSYSGYLTDTDSVKNTAKSKAKGMDGDLVLNLHLIKTLKRFDMPISAHIGYSSFNIAYNDVAKTVAKGGGYSYGFSVNPRVYLTKHIGFYFNLGYLSYLYPNLQFSDKTTKDLNAVNNKDWKVALSGSGATLGGGFIIKI